MKTDCGIAFALYIRALLTYPLIKLSIEGGENKQVKKITFNFYSYHG